MKRSFLFCLIAVLLIGGVVAAGCAPAAAPAPALKPAPAPAPAPAPQAITWKLQSFTVAGTNMWDGYLVPFADAVKQKSGGNFQIQLNAPGAIVGPMDITKAVGQGVVPVGLTSPGYDTGIIPEAYVLTGLPFSYTNEAQQLEFWYSYQGGAAFQAVTDAYNAKSVQPVSLLVLHDPMVMMTQFNVSAVSDFQGKKIRATGAHAEAVKALGAQQVTLGIGDVYNALQTGVIDGHFMAISGLETYKWKEVTKYVVQPAWLYCSPALLEVNAAEWNKLSPENKAIFQDAARTAVTKDLDPYAETAQARYVDAAKKAGVQFVTLSDPEVVKYRAATAPLWAYAAKISPKAGQVVDLLKAFLKDKGVAFPGS